MATSFELMDLDSGNLVGSYDDFDSALAIVRSAYEAYEWSGIADLGLFRVTDEGNQELVAADIDLARLAVGNVLVLHGAPVLARTHGGGSTVRVIGSTAQRLGGTWHYWYVQAPARRTAIPVHA